MPIAAIFAEEAAAALAAELAPYAAGEAALAAGTALGAEALMGLGAEALGTSAIGGAEAALTADAMAANAAAGGAGAGGAGINAAQVAAQQNAAMQLANPGITGIPETAANVITSPVPGFQPTPGFEGITSGPQGASPNFFNPSATVAPGQGPLPDPRFQLNAPSANQSLRLGSSLESITPSGPISSVLPPPSPLEVGMDKAIEFAKKNPFTAMTGAYMGANALGLLNPSGATFNDKPYDGPLSRYRLASDFQGRTANPLDFQYKPRYAEGGGIMGAGSYDIPVGYDEGGPVTEAQKDAAKRAFELANPNGLGPSVNVGGYGTLNFQNDAAYDQFNQNPQSMTFSQGPGGVRYVEPKAADYDTRFQNLSMGMGGGGGKANTDLDLRGGDMAFAKGGSLSESIESYQKMLGGQQQAAPAASRDVGIYYDQDPDTRYQDALTAAQIRQAKVNQRAYVSPPAAKRPTPLGKLNMPTSGKSKGGDDVEAASGGIMRSYAGGGITGEGNLDLHIPLNLGGGGGGGYTPVGGGFSSGGDGSGNTSVFNGQNNTAGGNFGGMGSLMPSQGLGSAPQQSGYGGIPPEFMPTNKGSSYNTTTTSDIMGRNMNIPAGLDDSDMGAIGLLTQQQNAAARASYANANPASMSDLAKRLGYANGGMTGYAMGGGIMQSSLGGYAAGGNPRLLKGPGDGMSDNIPATINGRQPARLADGEFVIPADVVSHLGNGSTDAGAKHLHAMMDKVRKARTGNPKQGKQINAKKYLPK